eukprot:gene24323-30646_t
MLSLDLGKTSPVVVTFRPLEQITQRVQSTITCLSMVEKANQSRSALGSEEDKYCGVSMSGVCPGDTIGERISAAVNVIQGRDVNTDRTPPVGGHAVCLDDMYMLDTTTREWFRIHTALAPLPRKGHSMCVAQIDGAAHIVIFGGYSMDNLTLSNSVHVCAVSKLVQYCANNRQNATVLESQTISKTTSAKSVTNQSVVFRTLNCKGTSPSPRYRHSCTIVEDVSRGEQILVIIGGIGKDVSVSLCDVHLLNLSSFQWLPVKNGSDGLLQGLSGEGPANGIYGHAAFAVRKAMNAVDATNSDADDLHTELLVYGGSSNASAGKTNCHRFIYAFDMSSHNWRKVSTGFAFPAARNNHSATVVAGWAPTNEVPNGRPRTQSALSPQSAAVVIFGGVNSIMCASDTWALDLQWRPAGVEGYDGHATQRVQEELATQDMLHSASKTELRFLQTVESFKEGENVRSGSNLTGNNRSIHSHNNLKYLQSTGAGSGSRPGSAVSTPTAAGFRSGNQETLLSNLAASASESQFATSVGGGDGSMFRSASGPSLLPRGGANKTNLSRSFDLGGTHEQAFGRHNTGTSSSNVREGSDDADVGHAFLKVRKERAQSDLLLKRERERAILAETESRLFQEHLVSLESDFSAERLRYEAEIAVLKEQLEHSLQRERDLHSLNGEAYRLLVLHGMQHT